MRPSITVFIGTKAQYIKTAPVLREMDSRGIDYWLVDSGQHGRLSSALRGELRVREPDSSVGGTTDITSFGHAAVWSLRLAARAWNRRKVREEVFGGRPGICVVHGDTPSTLLATILARRAGLRVAHLEAGLRSPRVLHPFPEELIRRWVMRSSDLLFAPDETTARTLQQRGLGPRTIRTSANTVVDALRWSLADQPVSGRGSVVVTMHRVENLHRKERVRGFIELVLRIARKDSITFVVHGPTEAVIRPHRERLLAAGVELRPLLPHAAFTRLLAAAPYVVTDGGSIQEECALLGVPTLLWRAESERQDGLGANVVVSRYDARVVGEFIQEYEWLRRKPIHDDVHPSAEIVDHLLASLDAPRRTT